MTTHTPLIDPRKILCSMNAFPLKQAFENVLTLLVKYLCGMYENTHTQLEAMMLFLYLVLSAHTRTVDF